MGLLRLMVILLVGISTLLMVVHSLLLVPRNPLPQPPTGPRRSLERTGRSPSRALRRSSACRGSQYRTPHEIAQAAPPLQEAEVTTLLKQRLQLAAEQNPTLSSVEAKQSQQLQAMALRSFRFNETRELPDNDEYRSWPHYVQTASKNDWLRDRMGEAAHKVCIDWRNERALSCDARHPVGKHGPKNPAAWFTRGVRWDRDPCPATADEADGAVAVAAAAAVPGGAAPLHGGLTWVIDISHGNTRSWSNICHWANTMYVALTVFSEWRRVAAASGAPPPPRIAQVALYQVRQAEFLAPRGIPTDWYEKTMRIVLDDHQQTQPQPTLLFAEHFNSSTPRCFAHTVTVGVDTKAPHFYDVATADRWRRATVRTLRLPPSFDYRLPAADTLTLLWRTTDRKVSNEAEIEAKVRALLGVGVAPGSDGAPVGVGWQLQVKRLAGPLPFVEQVRLYASSSVLLSMHGAQLTNSPFMPRGSVLVEVFNCGHWSHTYRKFAEEAGVQYLHVRDPARGCQKDFGKLIGNTDRALDFEVELRPAMCEALSLLEAAKARLASWALPPDDRAD